VNPPAGPCSAETRRFAGGIRLAPQVDQNFFRVRTYRSTWAPKQIRSANSGFRGQEPAQIARMILVVHLRVVHSPIVLHLVPWVDAHPFSSRGSCADWAGGHFIWNTYLDWLAIYGHFRHIATSLASTLPA
jgi:hypothetical protein